MAEHILEHRFEKVIVITDGYASMKPENLKALQDRRVMTLTILLEQAYVQVPWRDVGEVMQLDEVLV